MLITSYEQDFGSTWIKRYYKLLWNDLNCSCFFPNFTYWLYCKKDNHSG